MLDKIKNLGKQTAAYGFGSILNKVLGFILIPIYQKHIPIEEFGNLVYFETITLFLSAILSYGISVGHQRFFYIEKENKTYGLFLFNNFIGCILLASLSVFPMILFSGTIAESLTGLTNQTFNLQITLATVVVELIYILPLQVLQYENKPGSYIFYNALKLIVSFIISVVLVINFDMGITGFLLARFISVLLIVLITYFSVISPRCTFRFHIESLMKSLRFGFPHVVSTIGYTVFTVTDRFMLQALSTQDELGKYGFGARIANFINLIFVQTIGMSYFPSLMNNEKAADNLRYYRKMLTYYSFLISFLILGFLFYYKDILWIVGKNKEYWEGLNVVPILSLSFMVMGMNYFVQAGLFLKNKTKYYLIPSAIAVPVNIGLNFLLIPDYGMMGAALSVLSAQIVYTALLSYISGRFMKVGYEWAKILLVCFLAMALYGVSEVIELHNIIFQWIFKAFLIAILPFALYLLGFFEKIEIQSIRNVWKKYTNYKNEK